MNRLRTVGLALLVASFAVAASAGTLTENFSHTYPLSSGGLFSIVNINGEVIVEAWDRDSVEISAVKTVKADNDSDAQDTMKAMRIDVIASANSVQVETKLPPHDNGFLSWLAGRNINAKVDYHVKVPRHLQLKVDNTNGRVGVTGTSGKADVETTNGSIEASSAQGDLRFTTTNGHLTLDELAGSVRAETTNGGIHATLNKVDGDLAFETTNGSIKLSLPNSIRANLDASTTNGSIHSDFEVSSGKSSKHHMVGPINGGGGKLSLETTNGSITISQGQ
jgi:DUF4097 and DUF4098 domain-containing protein YvlB